MPQEKLREMLQEVLGGSMEGRSLFNKAVIGDNLAFGVG